MSWFVTFLEPTIPRALGTANLLSTGDTKQPRIVDKTGLTGKYDITLEYDCEWCRSLTAYAAPGVSGTAPPAPASEPSGAPDIFTAIEKQLGLKLTKAPDVALPVIVIDHIERVPAEN